ncbi:hypothetical protein BWQ96_02437 [Gracilariopsis chorda]|uniref:Uncharacterized protein n=1 Tax=Gracilariopsis chorda TaxID=448386 RepID=A0A2V3J0A1_9FLOR|nr:hypothetical protein BWQ96_02437 [Gracilariopsis chorda]|eukprot:PXF47755.1 hypothetical protein BWQ96_02437 [Gracilariopsis chorda]
MLCARRQRDVKYSCFNNRTRKGKTAKPYVQEQSTICLVAERQCCHCGKPAQSLSQICDSQTPMVKFTITCPVQGYKNTRKETTAKGLAATTRFSVDQQFTILLIALF